MPTLTTIDLTPTTRKNRRSAQDQANAAGRDAYRAGRTEIPAQFAAYADDFRNGYNGARWMDEHILRGKVAAATAALEAAREEYDRSLTLMAADVDAIEAKKIEADRKLAALPPALA